MSETLPIKQVMTTVPIRLAATESVRTALGIMQMHEVRHLPVVDGQEVIGIISERDLLVVQNESSGESPEVGRVCSFDKYQVEPDTPLEKVLEEMANRHIGSALVVQGHELLGIFTATDACRLWAKHLRGEKVNQL